MTILDRQFLKELTLNFVFTFVVITAIALFAIATVAFYRFPELDLLLFATLVRWSFVQALVFLLPLSLLIAVVFVYGRAAADNEITTLKASGIHPYRVILPGLLLALCMSALMIEVLNEWEPWALYQRQVIPAQQGALKTLLEKSIARDQKSIVLPGKDPRQTLHWQSVTFPESGVELETVYYESEPARKPGSTKPPAITLVSAERAIGQFDERNHRIVLKLVKPKVITGTMEGMEQGGLFIFIPIATESSRQRLKFQSTRELFAFKQRAGDTVELGGHREPLLRRFELAEVEGRIHERMSRAVTPIVFLLLGVPLALVFRSSNRLVAFLLASLIAMFVYYPVDKLANVLMSQELVAPVIACWSGNVLLASIGCGLLLFVVRR